MTRITMMSTFATMPVGLPTAVTGQPCHDPDDGHGDEHDDVS